MRAKYKEVKFRLLLKEKELERFRKNSKLTKLQEIDVAAIFVLLFLFRLNSIYIEANARD